MALSVVQMFSCVILSKSVWQKNQGDRTSRILESSQTFTLLVVMAEYISVIRLLRILELTEIIMEFNRMDHM